MARWIALVLCVSCGGGSGSTDATGICNTPGRGVPCSGQITGDVAGMFTCTPRFAHFDGTNTTFGLTMSPITDPFAGVSQITLSSLDFAGMATTTMRPGLRNGDTISVELSNATHDTFVASIGIVVNGQLMLSFSDVTPRVDGPGGDFCLNGSLVAGLVHQGMSLRMMVDF